MPFDGNKWSSKKMVSLKEILKIVATTYPIEKITKLEEDANDTSKVSLNRTFLFNLNFK